MPTRSAWPGRGRVSGRVAGAVELLRVVDRVGRHDVDPLGPLGVADLDGDRTALGRAEPQAAEDADLVLLELHAGSAPVAEPAARERVLDVVGRDLDPGGQPLEHPHQGFSVRLSGGQPTQHGGDPPIGRDAPRPASGLRTRAEGGAERCAVPVAGAGPRPTAPTRSPSCRPAAVPLPPCRRGGSGGRRAAGACAAAWAAGWRRPRPAAAAVAAAGVSMAAARPRRRPRPGPARAPPGSAAGRARDGRKRDSPGRPAGAGRLGTASAPPRRRRRHGST